MVTTITTITIINCYQLQPKIIYNNTSPSTSVGPNGSDNGIDIKNSDGYSNNSTGNINFSNNPNKNSPV
jgi:hypothetical protein